LGDADRQAPRDEKGDRSSALAESTSILTGRLASAL
jgi:hypothetical protein